RPREAVPIRDSPPRKRSSVRQFARSPSPSPLSQNMNWRISSRQYRARRASDFGCTTMGQVNNLGAAAATLSCGSAYLDRHPRRSLHGLLPLSVLRHVPEGVHQLLDILFVHGPHAELLGGRLDLRCEVSG